MVHHWWGWFRVEFYWMIYYGILENKRTRVGFCFVVVVVVVVVVLTKLGFAL
jgi:hypothetical protein